MKIDSPNALGISTGFGIPTGGTDNQLLVKTGSTDYATGWVDYGEWISGGTISISGLTTSPTKGTIVYDSVRYRRINLTTWEVEYNFSQSTAGTAGSGLYIFRLPSGITWGNGVLTTTSSDNETIIARTLITKGQVIISSVTQQRMLCIIPYTSTQFRMIGANLDGDYAQVSSTYYSLVNDGLSYKFSFYTSV